MCAVCNLDHSQYHTIVAHCCMCSADMNLRMRLCDDDPLPAAQVWLPVEHSPSGTGMPTSAMMDDGNGGEYRKTFHAYAPPFAQLVESPTVVNGIAMQIDTWNRDAMNLTVRNTIPRAFLFNPGP